jgi:hypothetical protein
VCTLVKAVDPVLLCFTISLKAGCWQSFLPQREIWNFVIFFIKKSNRFSGNSHLIHFLLLHSNWSIYKTPVGIKYNLEKKRRLYWLYTSKLKLLDRQRHSWCGCRRGFFKFSTTNMLRNTILESTATLEAFYSDGSVLIEYIYICLDAPGRSVYDVGIKRPFLPISLGRKHLCK